MLSNNSVNETGYPTQNKTSRIPALGWTIHDQQILRPLSTKQLGHDTAQQEA